MEGRGTSDIIAILMQLQKRFHSKNKNQYFAFINLEKAFDRLSRQILWWSVRRLEVDEWIIQQQIEWIIARPLIDACVISLHCWAQTLEVVDLFCYLGATINAGGGCTHSAIARAGSAWGKLRELLPLLTNTYILIKTRGNIFNICVRSVLLYGSKCWAVRKVDKMQLERNNWAMIR